MSEHLQTLPEGTSGHRPQVQNPHWDKPLWVPNLQIRGTYCTAVADSIQFFRKKSLVFLCYLKSFGFSMHLKCCCYLEQILESHESENLTENH